MSDLPKSVRINEEGPREGFQFEKGAIPTARKIELIDSLSKTGLKQIQTVSFVPPKNVPGMADADAADLIAYLRTLPAVRRPNHPHDGELPLARLAYRAWRLLFFQPPPATPSAAISPPDGGLARGERDARSRARRRRRGRVWRGAGLLA